MLVTWGVLWNCGWILHIRECFAETFGEAGYLPYEPNSEPKSVHQLSYHTSINPHVSWSNRHFPIVKSHFSYGFRWFPMGAPRIGTPPTFPSSPSSVSSVSDFTVVALVEFPVTSTCTGRTGWLTYAQNLHGAVNYHGKPIYIVIEKHHDFFFFGVYA